jgi:hypothetical protein
MEHRKTDGEIKVSDESSGPVSDNAEKPDA